MKCYFPIPYHSSNNSRVICNPQPYKNQQADTIYELRMQNELLKQQLSALMKNKDNQQTKDVYLQSRTLQKNVLNNEQEVQQNYKNKMLKLKSGRSKSRNANQYETALSYSKKQEYCQEFNQTHRRPFLPLPLRNQQNLKVMIVQRDSNGRFYRDGESEQKVKTVRMNSPQTFPFHKNIYSPKFIQNQNIQHQFVGNVKKPKGHRRSETAPIQDQNVQLTKRLYQRYSTETKQNICEFSRQIIDSTRQNFQCNIKPSFKKMPANNQMRLNLNAKCAESIDLIKPKVLSPRGAAYIEALNSKDMQKQIELNENKNESILSIEQGINETKRKRKLRYDIYLDDEKDK